MSTCLRRLKIAVVFTFFFADLVTDVLTLFKYYEEQAYEIKVLATASFTASGFLAVPIVFGYGCLLIKVKASKLVSMLIMLRYIEVTMESIPQLTINFYVWSIACRITAGSNFSQNGTIPTANASTTNSSAYSDVSEVPPIQYISAVFSFIGICYAILEFDAWEAWSSEDDEDDIKGNDAENNDTPLVETGVDTGSTDGNTAEDTLLPSDGQIGNDGTHADTGDDRGRNDRNAGVNTGAAVGNADVIRADISGDMSGNNCKVSSDNEIGFDVDDRERLNDGRNSGNEFENSSGNRRRKYQFDWLEKFLLVTSKFFALFARIQILVFAAFYLGWYTAIFFAVHLLFVFIVVRKAAGDDICEGCEKWYDTLYLLFCLLAHQFTWALDTWEKWVSVVCSFIYSAENMVLLVVATIFKRTQDQSCVFTGVVIVNGVLNGGSFMFAILFTLKRTRKFQAVENKTKQIGDYMKTRKSQLIHLLSRREENEDDGGRRMAANN